MILTRWFFVLTYDFREGMEEELEDWLKEKGERHWRSLPNVRSVKTYIRCFGLGQRPVFQTWLEIPDLTFLDNCRKDPEFLATLEGGPEFDRLIKNFNASIIREVTG